MDVTTSEVTAAREGVRRAAVLLAKVSELLEAGDDGEDYWEFEPENGDPLKDQRESVYERVVSSEQDYREEVLVEAVRDAVRDLWSAAEFYTDAAIQARRLADSILEHIEECSGMGSNLDDANEVLRLLEAIQGHKP